MSPMSQTSRLSGACSVEMFPAAYGDCFLVRHVSGSVPTNILIDAGLVRTYPAALRTRLHELAAQGESINLLVVTHIDGDHIGGALALLHENGNADRPQVIGIDEVWHNSYRHLQPAPAAAVRLRDHQEEIIRDIVSQGYPAEDLGLPNDLESPISARQGSSFASMLLKGGYSWNTSFGAGPATCEAPMSCFARGEVSITLLAPNRAKLDRLLGYWRASLSRQGFGEAVNGPFDDAFEFLAAGERSAETNVESEVSASKPSIEDLLKSPFVEDESVTNGSSIAFVLEAGGRRMVFLGDAHPSLISHQLTVLSPEIPFRCDLMKVAHHGSRANTSPALLERVDCPLYLLSSSGERFGHPDPETVLRIAAAPGAKKLVFNYPTAAAKLLQDPSVMDRFGYSLRIGNGIDPVRIEL